MPAPLASPTLAAFLESGVSILLGTRDAAHVPECVRCVGARVDAEGAELTVLAPVATAGATEANVRTNGRAAVFFSRPMDHHSLQVKGALVEVRAAAAPERALVDAYMRALAATLAEVGVPGREFSRVVRWPCLSVRLRVDGVSVQTPGPGAGAPLGGRAAR